MGIRQQMDKMYAVDDSKIGKMASVDIASGGVLPLPEKGESVNIRILSPPKHVINDKLPNKEGAITARCVIYGRESDLQYDFWLSSTIYKGVLAELRKGKIPVDDDLKCIVGRVFTIAGREWPHAPKEMFKIDEVTKKPIAPKTYSVALRTDLEAKAAPAPGPEGTAPDLMTF
jgi:hypothetical protein